MTVNGNAIVLFAIVCTTLVLFSNLDLRLLGNVVLPWFSIHSPVGCRPMINAYDKRPLEAARNPGKDAMHQFQVLVGMEQVTQLPKH